ncbi:GNAT family N-acetyltransferase [Heliobacterium undosum]|uniref:GNAT family N-acetyltransferase n=1 Tax=Heliomicrobium undosum TaxID=121734 RepID=A0A845L357_9FIRM|nr:GNAT family N-acetyltransferase [Heliomicrobium undosum]MZP29549.1 GNAT family N-acetyltransferase [Heliomicrobium undosum]
MNIFLRPVQKNDEPFLYELFVSSRPDLDWIGADDEVKGQILTQQFFAEEQGNAGADRRIALLDDKPIGRLYLREEETSIHILAIALLPEYRSRGIGTRLLEAVQKSAAESGKKLRLRVMWFNGAARSLYERFAFRVINDSGVCVEMEWDSRSPHSRDEE